VKRVVSVWILLASLCACGGRPVPACQPVTYHEADYTVCKARADADIRLFLRRPNGKPLSSFEAANAKLAREDNAQFVFAMNAGMYREDRAPVGLYVEQGEELAPLSLATGGGNFGLVPNGVFYMAEGRAGLAETTVFAEMAPMVDYATQSGPMLVIGGELHPAFNPDGPSKKKRNGVGISEDGAFVYFVISDDVVNFHSFASLFRDHLGTPNALFLDGTISRLFDPATERRDPGLPMGPMIGLVVRTD